jgi:hypothetical protein
MTLPGQYLFQNFFNGNVGQAVYGPPGILGGDFGATTNAAVPAAQVQEVVMAGPVPADMAAVQVGTPVAAWIAGGLGAAEVMPYARVSAAGVVTLGTGNLAAAPAGFGPVAPSAAAYQGIMRHQFPLQGAILAGAAAGPLAFPSPGAVATRQGLEAISPGVIVANSSTLAIVNPTAALPAGFMCGHIRPGIFDVRVQLSNLTAAPADPGVTNWNVHIVSFDNTIAADMPSGQNGPIAVQVIPGLTVPFGVIAGATVGEGSVAVAGLEPGDGILVCPRSALPDPNMAPSHSRCAVSGTLIWGMANLDPAVATAAADIVCDVAIFKAAPIF